MAGLQHEPTIDRHALVTRHNVTLNAFDGERPIQVGNGHFAFGMDVTGLQTFAPFNTMSDWGWNSSPLPLGLKLDDFHGQVWDTHGRPVRYPMPDPEQPELTDWMAGNPHRVNLVRLGFDFKLKNGLMAQLKDLGNPKQTLDLWSGTVTSSYTIDGDPVKVTTLCHPDSDALSVKVESPLIEQGRLTVFMEAPGDAGGQFANFVGDDGSPDHWLNADNHPWFRHQLDDLSYFAQLHCDQPATVANVQPIQPPTIVRAVYGSKDHTVDVTKAVEGMLQSGRTVRAGNSLGGDPAVGKPKSLRISYQAKGQSETLEFQENEQVRFPGDTARYRVIVTPAGGSHSFSFSCRLGKEIERRVPAYDETAKASEAAWKHYWQSGGAIDLSGSTDPRWFELERRIVLSQYLMKVNEAGDTPPQESGLVNNGWFGRFHMEMYWWHATHWALWNRWPELDRSLGIYQKLLHQAQILATGEGYLGARWPKCIAPDGREWPHIIHSLLLWQQPHPLFFAELDYRAHPNRKTLEKWAPVVEATADFLASYAWLNPETKKYDLGPPLILASENNDPKTAKNPTFELGYWRFGLRIAHEWWKRMGKTPKKTWDTVCEKLAPLPQEDGLYLLYEGVPDMWTKFNFEHPALTATYGLLPGDGVDAPTMVRTLAQIEKVWNFDRTWGWDYPMLAMCAARLGQPEQAINFLLTDKPGFQFDARGLATGGPFPYFPSNGALLYAVAMMAAGWDGAKGIAPGFPQEGWKVRFEGLSQAP